MTQTHSDIHDNACNCCSLQCWCTEDAFIVIIGSSINWFFHSRFTAWWRLLSYLLTELCSSHDTLYKRYFSGQDTDGQSTMTSLTIHLGALCLDIIFGLTAWHSIIQLKWGMVWFLGVGYGGQPVTCDWPYNLLATRFRSSSSHVVCTESFSHWPRPLCCKSTQEGLYILWQMQTWDGPDNVTYGE